MTAGRKQYVIDRRADAACARALKAVLAQQEQWIAYLEGDGPKAVTQADIDRARAKYGQRFLRGKGSGAQA